MIDSRGLILIIIILDSFSSRYLLRSSALEFHFSFKPLLLWEYLLLLDYWMIWSGAFLLASLIDLLLNALDILRAANCHIQLLTLLGSWGVPKVFRFDCWLRYKVDGHSTVLHVWGDVRSSIRLFLKALLLSTLVALMGKFLVFRI